MRALLFSADERTAQVLTPLLAEFGFEVERCSEIIAAVEKLTTQAFPAVLADWTGELEAEFLLKTAHELKRNKPSFTLAIVEPKDASAASQAGADGVLMKPIAVEVARNTLLAARDLIECAPSAGPARAQHEG